MPDTYSLPQKVAIVTGSGRENGIGAAIALALARNGAWVVINHVSESSASRAQQVAKQARKLGGKAIVVQGSVTSRDGARKIVRETMDGFGVERIDILVNNAGGPTISHETKLLDMDPAQIQDDFALNYMAPVYMIQEVVPYMPSGGRIINIGGLVSRIYLPGAPAYGASKAAMDHSTRVFAAELGKSKGITVNVVAPGGVMTDALLVLPETDRKMLEAVSRQLAKAADRMGTIEDIADVVLFVASEKSRWITGHVFAAGGGIGDF